VFLGLRLGGARAYFSCTEELARGTNFRLTKREQRRMEKSDEFCFLYSTFPDAESADKAARTLIALHLAACVNVYPPMKSFYIWQGKTEEEQEVAAFIKTRRSLVQKAVAAVRPLHPYSVPCFLVLPIEEGAEDYLAWARRQTEAITTI
jgi:periplasmic divalent cation tolerance protein